jgi:hypothetical protein
LDFRKKLKKLKCKALSILEHDNKPIELWSNKVIQQRQIMYIISKKGWFIKEDYVYSSAIDYAGQKV